MPETWGGIPVVIDDRLDPERWYLIADWTKVWQEVVEFWAQGRAVELYGLCAGCEGMGV